MAQDTAAMRPWITARIHETRELADEARAAASDIEDRALVDATVQLAEDCAAGPTLSLAVDEEINDEHAGCDAPDTFRGGQGP